jgi:phage terminase small subunit
MKKGYMIVGALLLAFTISGTADACTATHMVDRADAIKETDAYGVIKGVVQTEIASDEGWERPEAVDAAVGTIVREYADLTGQEIGGLKRADGASRDGYITQSDVDEYNQAIQDYQSQEYQDYITAANEYTAAVNEYNGYIQQGLTPPQSVIDNVTQKQTALNDAVTAANQAGTDINQLADDLGLDAISRQQELLAKKSAGTITEDEMRELEDMWEENLDTELTGYEQGDLDDPDFVRDFLTQDTNAKRWIVDPTYPEGGYWKWSIGHESIGITTVADHATFHGNEWENGYDEIWEKELDWYEEMDPANSDHAG